MKPTDRYLKLVEWSEEDGCSIGTCPGVILIYGGIHGDDEIKVYRELCQAVAEAVELYQADDKPLPPETANKEFYGRFVLRVDKVASAAGDHAMRAGERV